MGLTVYTSIVAMQPPAAIGSTEQSAAEVESFSEWVSEWVRKKRPPYLMVCFEFLITAGEAYDTWFNTSVLGINALSFIFVNLLSRQKVVRHLVSLYFQYSFSSWLFFMKRNRGLPTLAVS